jgi:hypothetical protein
MGINSMVKKTEKSGIMARDSVELTLFADTQI